MRQSTAREAPVGAPRVAGSRSSPAPRRSRGRRAGFALAGAFAMVVLAGCGGEPNAQAGVETVEGTIRATTTTSMITDMVEQVGGDDVEVTGLMGPGVDPHLYEASQGDIAALTDADVVFYNGLFLEGQMNDILVQTAQQAPAVRVTEAIAEDQLLESEDYEGQADPHVWFDPVLWETAVDPVVRQLSQLKPDRAEAFERNGEEYKRQIAEAHAYVEQQLALVPEEQRVLVTGHDAFRYFGQRYGFEVRGLQGISTESEAGAGDVRDLAGYLVENRIRAIFTESSIPRRNVEAVQAACEAQGWDLTIPDRELYSDAMGEPGSEDGTYPGMVRANAETIAGALAAGG